jgi:polyphosphate kinase 2 (PPK2 family)
MFEAAEVGRKLEKDIYKAQVPILRAELLDAQQQLLRAPFPVIVLFAGVDAAGKSETASLLNEWMDPHWIVTRGYMDPSEEELERPRLWRYWRDLPPKGRIALFLSAWYSSPIRDRVARRTTNAEFDVLLDEIAAFERALTDDGAVILKFWMHLGKAAQKKRFKAWEKDPCERWRVGRDSWRHWKMFDKFVAAADRAIRHTSTDHAPWQIVEGEDERYRRRRRRYRAARCHSRGARARTGHPRASHAQDGASRERGSVQRSSVIERDFNVLDTPGHDTAARPEALRRSPRASAGPSQSAAARSAEANGHSTILVFEGWDAAGKGRRDPPDHRRARCARL